MSRYIDADRLRKDILGLPNCYNGFSDTYDKALIIDRIDEQPTADVVDRDKAQKEIDYWHDKAQSYEQTILKLSLNRADVVEVVRCKDCIYYDSEHIENNGIRYDYKDMPKEAFDTLGTGLVNIEYGINVGGRCCRDYNVGYSEDKRIFVPETNYCGRAERRTDERLNQQTDGD